MLVVLALALGLAQSPANGGVVQSSSTSAQETTPEAKLSTSELAQLQSKAGTGDAAAQLALGRAYQDGNGVPQNDELAVKWYRKAAELGNATAQNNLGIMYRTGSGVEKSKEEAVKWYRKSARQGYASAMFNLGTAYYNGDGVPIDDCIAYAWFLAARENGSKSATAAVIRAESELTSAKMSDALVTLGEMYELGEELPRNFGESALWYRKAVKLGKPEARIALAVVLLEGHSVQDYGEARRSCEHAAKENDDRAQYCLGLIYQQGLGLQKDISRATKSYRRAAERGNVPAMLALGEIYSTGENGALDRPEAFIWFIRAASKGSPGALILAAKLKGTMDKKDLESADEKLHQSHIDPKKLEAVLQRAGSN
jgi:TPR repeat protein